MRCGSTGWTCTRTSTASASCSATCPRTTSSTGTCRSNARFGQRGRPALGRVPSHPGGKRTARSIGRWRRLICPRTGSSSPGHCPAGQRKRASIAVELLDPAPPRFLPGRADLGSRSGELQPALCVASPVSLTVARRSCSQLIRCRRTWPAPTAWRSSLAGGASRSSAPSPKRSKMTSRFETSQGDSPSARREDTPTGRAVRGPSRQRRRSATTAIEPGTPHSREGIGFVREWAVLTEEPWRRWCEIAGTLGDPGRLAGTRRGNVRRPLPPRRV